MFEVQPGKSFHSVEEVAVETDESGRQRLSFSGWFHKAQLGEEDFGDEPLKEAVSSRNQLAKYFHESRHMFLTTFTVHFTTFESLVFGQGLHSPPQ